ncbi:MAG: ABC transporter permease subunit [Promethearchaeota archaeon]
METITIKKFKLEGRDKQLNEPPKDRGFVITLLLPGLIIFALAILFPIVTGIFISFTDSEASIGYFGSKLTIVNYYELLVYGNYNTRDFWRYTYQTLFFSVISLTLEFLLGLIFALLLNKKFKGRGIARATLLIPWAIPTVASATIFRFEIFNTADEYGLVNSLIGLFGGRPIDFFGPDAEIFKLGDFLMIINIGLAIFLAIMIFIAIYQKKLGTSKKRIISMASIIISLIILTLIAYLTELEFTMTMITAIIIDVWKTTPFITLLILAALQIVPEDLYKAADIAGASGWQKFRYVTWPLIRPGVGVALIFRMMQALRVYDAIVVFNDDSVRSMTSHAVLLWLNGDYGLASAVTVMLLVFIVVFGVIISLLTRREKGKRSKLKSIFQRIGQIPILSKDRKQLILTQNYEDNTKLEESISAINIEEEKIPINKKNITKLPLITETKVKWYIISRRIKKVIFSILVVIMCLFCAGPFIWIIFRSFRDPFITQSGFELFNLIKFTQTGIEFINYFSTGAYGVIFGSRAVYGVTFERALLNGFILSGTTVLVVLIAGSLIAYALAKFSFKFKRGLNGFIFSMNSLPPLIIIIPFYIQIVGLATFVAQVNPLGVTITSIIIIIATILIALLAIAKDRIKASKKVLITISIIVIISVMAIIFSPFVANWIKKFFDLRDNLMGLVLPYAAFNLPLGVFILVAFFKEIPEDLWKAAKVDGASNFQIFRKIILPLTIPGIFTTAILVFIASWNELLFAQIFLTSPINHTVPRAILRYVRNPQSLTATWDTDIALLAATTIATIPLVIVVLIFQKKIISGLTRGAVKG